MGLKIGQSLALTVFGHDAAPLSAYTMPPKDAHAFKFVSSFISRKSGRTSPTLAMPLPVDDKWEMWADSMDQHSSIWGNTTIPDDGLSGLNNIPSKPDWDQIANGLYAYHYAWAKLDEAMKAAGEDWHSVA